MSLRDLDFDDSFQSNNSPTQGSFNANSVPTFVDDAAFVTAKGSAAADGDAYVNTTSNKLRVFQGGAWQNQAEDADVITNTADIATNTADIATNTSSISTGLARVEDDLLTRQNLGLATSVASSALTIEIKQSDGTTDPTASLPVKISYRSTTLANGSYSIQSFSAATFVIVPSGATLGHTSGADEQIYLYSIYDGTNHELAVSASYFPENSLYSTTLMSASSDSKGVLYSTVARTGCAIRLLSVMATNQVTAGTWALVPTEIDLSLASKEDFFASYDTDAGQLVPSPTSTRIDYEDKIFDSHDAVTTGVAWLCTVPFDGIYTVNAEVLFNSNAAWNGSSESCRIEILIDGTVTTMGQQNSPNTSGVAGAQASDMYRLVAGQTIAVNVVQGSGSSLNIASNDDHNRVSIRRIGGL